MINNEIIVGVEELSDEELREERNKCNVRGDNAAAKLFIDELESRYPMFREEDATNGCDGSYRLPNGGWSNVMWHRVIFFSRPARSAPADAQKKWSVLVRSIRQRELGDVDCVCLSADMLKDGWQCNCGARI